MGKTEVRALIAIAILATIYGCATFTDSVCIVMQPIQPTADDVRVMSDDLVNQLLVHNESWARTCDKDWKPFR